MIQTILTQAPQIIPVITDDRDFYVNVVLAVITFFAVLAALSQEWLKKRLYKARIKFEIKKIPPDCHQIMLTNPQTGASVGRALYSRIRVTNESSTNTAQNVEVFVSHFWKINSSGETEEIHTFLPMNLKWSHTGEIRTTVLPSFFRYCDLGSFRKVGNSTILLLDTIVQPNPVAGGVVPNIIEPGEYKFELIVSGENISPRRQKWSLKFGSEWNDNEQKMLESLNINEII